MIVFAFVVLLLSSNVVVTTGGEFKKVLVDESRVYGWDELVQKGLEEIGWPSDSDWTYSFENTENFWGFGRAANKIREVASVNIRKSGKLSYSTLKNYDVLVIASFEESYSSGEADAIKQFVKNGGGLLVLGNSEYSNNSISRSFDVLFHSETVAIADKGGVSKTFRYRNESIKLAKAFFFYCEDVKKHPVTKGIDKIGLYNGIPITSHESGTVLVKTGSDSWADRAGSGSGVKQSDEEVGPFDVIVSMENVGKGRAVFIGSSLSFWNAIVEEEEQNQDLLRNAVGWLGEVGGPYKQYKEMNEQAQQMLSDGVSLYESHTFSEVILQFNDTIDMFEKSKIVYPNAEATEGIETCESYIQKCETGINANGTFDTAQGLYDKREYEKAIEEYEKAKLLYQEIEYAERAQECGTKVDESNAWIVLREKAAQEFHDAEAALSTAPSSLDPSGYKNARAAFEKAQSTWKEYDDLAQVRVCQEKMDLCDDEIAKIEKNRLILVVVIVVVVVIMKKRNPAEITEKVYQPPSTEEDALTALNDRYTKGEITIEEYEALKSVLEE